MAKTKRNFRISEAADEVLQQVQSGEYVSDLIEHHDERAKGALDILRRVGWEVNEVMCLIDITNGTAFTPDTPPIKGLPLDMQDAGSEYLDKWGVEGEHWLELAKGIDPYIAEALMAVREEFWLGNPRLRHGATT